MNALGRQVVELLAPRIGRVTATNAVLLKRVDGELAAAAEV